MRTADVYLHLCCDLEHVYLMLGAGFRLLLNELDLSDFFIINVT